MVVFDIVIRNKELPAPKPWGGKIKNPTPIIRSGVHLNLFTIP
jgi:hypothetical protein